MQKLYRRREEIQKSREAFDLNHLRTRVMTYGSMIFREGGHPAERLGSCRMLSRQPSHVQVQIFFWHCCGCTKAGNAGQPDVESLRAARLSRFGWMLSNVVGCPCDPETFEEQKLLEHSGTASMSFGKHNARETIMTWPSPRWGRAPPALACVGFDLGSRID